MSGGLVCVCNTGTRQGAVSVPRCSYRLTHPQNRLMHSVPWPGATVAFRVSIMVVVDRWQFRPLGYGSSKPRLYRTVVTAYPDSDYRPIRLQTRFVIDVVFSTAARSCCFRCRPVSGFFVSPPLARGRYCNPTHQLKNVLINGV